jgi:hypothetical protein
MKNNRDDLAVILAVYKDKMAKFFEINPEFHSCIANQIEFSGSSSEELLEIAQKNMGKIDYKVTSKAIIALKRYIRLRRDQPHFANARSIRNVLDRVRLRHTNIIFHEAPGFFNAEQLSSIDDLDILSSRVLNGGIDNY